jgi:hypothetical protein
MNIFDILVALNILMCNVLEVDDKIIFNTNIGKKIYGFSESYFMTNYVGNIPNTSSLNFTLLPIKELFLSLINERKSAKDALYYDVVKYSDFVEKQSEFIGNYYVDLNLAVFKTYNNTYYDTYTNYLIDHNNGLENFVTNNTTFSNLEKISYLSDLIVRELNNPEFVTLFNMPITHDYFLEKIMILLNYFRSYTVTLQNFVISYVYADTENAVKLTYEIDQHVNFGEKDLLNLQYLMLSTSNNKVYSYNLVNMLDKINSFALNYTKIDTPLALVEFIKKTTIDARLDNVNINDFITKQVATSKLFDVLSLQDREQLISMLIELSKINVDDNIEITIRNVILNNFLFEDKLANVHTDDKGFSMLALNETLEINIIE